ncbi:MAG: TVP38/TMEM64 family protein [Verrucomicrobia bacterium]|nr:TVP38/TMEM64 family protein [Verrucomicrobiota bacterium]
MKLAIAVLIVVVVAVLALRGVDLRELGRRAVALVDQGLDLIRAAGPLVFFTAVAVLPAIGAPLSVFSLMAGEAFAARLTMTGVVACTLAAIAVNLALTYWLARYALRPLLMRLLARYGYSVPRVTPDNALTVALVVRCTPGPPFFFQGYLLGCAEMPFRLYMIVSWLAVLPWTLAFVILGKAAREGHFGKIATALGLLVATTVAVQVLRRKFANRES